MKKGYTMRIILLLSCFILAFSHYTQAANVKEKTSINNIIMLIPDGLGISATTLARWYQNGQPLALDEIASGLIRTHSAYSAITDSAAGGTAYATGHKTEAGYIGMLPRKQQQPVATVLEGARLLGKSTGIVATAEMMHATPSAFTAHYPDRKGYEPLSKQQVYAGLDVVLGGGAEFLQAENRKDQEDLLGAIKEQGFDYLTTREQLLDTKSNKVWGMFAPKDMSYDFDRNQSIEPSLAEMTGKAIEILSRNDNGFFLLVEGSKIDWAAHNHDPIGIVSDVLAFDRAVQTALDYAKENQHTAIIVAADHSNGGLSIGNTNTTIGYDSLPLTSIINPLKKATLTGEGIEKRLNKKWTNIQEVLAEFYGINDLTKKEIKAVKNTKQGTLNKVIGPMISERANIGWTTAGHTGEEVVLYSYLPNNERLTGVFDNTEIAHFIAHSFGFQLSDVTKRLFVDANKGFAAIGAKTTLDKSNRNHPLYIAKIGDHHLTLPAHENIAYLNGERLTLEGLTIFDGKTFYVPQQAIDSLASRINSVS
ncbi:MAG TPA: alkaline phosphatase [Bacilli bacterium]|nr:alkaline phosphatase [Bacilli bacterium]